MFTVAVLVFLESFPFFQSTFLMILSTLNFIYLFVNKPLKTKESNRNELFDEICIYIICQLMTTFLNIAIPDDFKQRLGHVLIGVASLNIVLNMINVVRVSIFDLYITCRLKRATSKAASALEFKWESRERLIEKCPGKFSNFDEEIKI